MKNPTWDRVIRRIGKLVRTAQAVVRVGLFACKNMNKEGNKIIEIKIPNTKFLIVGKQKDNNLWDIHLIDPNTNFKDWIRKDASTESFIFFSNIILKTPFPNLMKKDGLSN